jgi:poly-beta-1,6-N-acetyl-D-glucosamine N-deacetylase
MKLVVLCYHSVHRPDLFEKQIRYLISAYNPITIKQLHSFLDGGEALPNNALLITFDDGDRTVLTEAMPILKRYGVPALLFVIPGLIGTENPFWWDEIKQYSEDEKAVGQAKLMDNFRRLALLESLRLKHREALITYPQLTWDELRLLEQNNIAIANHSHTHPMFDKISEQQMREEIGLSSELLRSKGFLFHTVFAYPNGNHNLLTEAVLREKGIQCAFLFDHRINNSIGNALRISRLSVNDNTSVSKLKFILSGWHSRLLPLIKKVYRLRS